MANEIMDLLKEVPIGSFRPYVELSPEADAVNVYFKSDADYSKRLTDHVTLYLSLETDEIVGCRIKGIRGILEDLPNFVSINHGRVDLSIIFWSFRGGIDDEYVRTSFKTLVKSAGNLKLPDLLAPSSAPS